MRSVPPLNARCCRSTPRCRSCPLRFASELRQVQARASGIDPSVPPHLAGVPACLHKYEPLFRRAADSAAAAVATAP
jgi:adenine-specific DNA glycosylase